MNMRPITAAIVVLAISACGNDNETMSNQDSRSEPQQVVALDVSSIESVEIVLNELRLKQQIFRWIAGDGKLWKSHKVGLKLAGLFDVINYLGSVGVEISDGYVNLCERYSECTHGHSPLKFRF